MRVSATPMARLAGLAPVVPKRLVGESDNPSAPPVRDAAHGSSGAALAFSGG